MDKAYTIIGAYGKEYGPVKFNVIRQWIEEGRANEQTMIRAGDDKPRPLLTFSEFKDMFVTASAAPFAQTAAAVAPPAPAYEMTPNVGAVGGSSYQTNDSNSQNTMIAIMEPIARSNFWLKFISVVNLLVLFGYLGIFLLAIFAAPMTGVSTVVAVVIGLIFIVPIWLYILVWKMGSRAKNAVNLGDVGEAIDAQNACRTIIIIIGVLTLLFIMFFIVGIVLGILSGADLMDYPGFESPFPTDGLD
ncbi:MAG: hypothetical protein AAGA45_05815 [Verrucomicrobiota bacterium]